MWIFCALFVLIFAANAATSSSHEVFAPSSEAERLWNEATRLYEQRQLDEAHAILEEILRRDPNHPSVHGSIGVIYHQRARKYIDFFTIDTKPSCF